MRVAEAIATVEAASFKVAGDCMRPVRLVEQLRSIEALVESPG